jgi:hypothetical protein
MSKIFIRIIQLKNTKNNILATVFNVFEKYQHTQRMILVIPKEEKRPFNAK